MNRDAISKSTLHTHIPHLQSQHIKDSMITFSIDLYCWFLCI